MKCKKCGCGWLKPIYDRDRDMLLYICPCGYYWYKEPEEKEKP